jgi:hypothetical protein
VSARTRPVSLAGERLIPVLAPLEPLLPQPGLLRGGVVATGGLAPTSLAVALAVAASAAGGWTAVVGLPGFGLAAAERAGMALERVVLVSNPPRRDRGEWASVCAALVEGFDVVLAGPPSQLRPADGRRLMARVRERQAVLVPVGWPAGTWPERADLELSVVSAFWEGLGRGWGYGQARRATVEVSGRRGADRPRRGHLWLPGPDGRVGAVPAGSGAAGAGAGPGGETLRHLRALSAAQPA